MIKYGFPLLTLAVGACATMPSPDGPSAPGAKSCDATPGQRFVGQKLSDGVQTEVRAATGSGSIRIIRPGQAVTMDYRVDRVNLELDERDIIAAVRCG